MYKIITKSSRVEKQFLRYLDNKINNKLEFLKINPRKYLGVHPLHGKRKDLWSCWFGGNIRMLYKIDDFNKLIIIFAVGSHNLY